MAKKPGPVAGSLGDTTYYYKSDGTVVDEHGVPASARISAMYTAPPPVEEAAVARAPKKKKKNNAQIAGVLSNTKYFYAPDGTVLDDQGRPAPDKIAAMFPAHEKREAIAEAMPKAPGIKSAPKAAATGVPNKVIKQFNKNLAITSTLVTSNQKIMESYPKLFEQMSNVVLKMTEQNEAIIRSVIENNQVFQDKVIETITGVKAPTQAGGGVAARPGRKGAGRKSVKANRSAAVVARAKRAKAKGGITSGMSTGAAIGLAVAGAAAVGVGAALINNASSPGGSGSTPGPQAAPVPLGSSGASAGEAGDRPTGKAGFNQIMESAKKAGDPFPEVVAAQWAIESGWGKHMTGKNNPFGQTGVEGREPGVRIATPRDPGGGSKFFRSFESIDEAVAFRVKKWAPKYAGAKTAEEALMMLQNYGKTPRYAQGYNNDWMSYVTSTSNTIRGMGIDPKVPKNGTQTETAQQTTPAAPSGGPTTASTPAAATTGAPQRRPSATPEEAAQHTANINELKGINDLLKRKGPGATLGTANAARKAELEQKIQTFQQRISLAPIQQAGTVRPLDTTGVPSQQQVQTSLASLGNGASTIPGMVKLKTPGGLEYTVAAQYASNFKGFVDELEKSGYKIKSIGGYANRNIAGTNKKSYHSLGAAIDINPSANPHLKDGRLQTDMPPNVGAIAAKYGLGWGGNWRSSKDAMHFSMGAGEGGSASIDRSGTTPVPGAPAPDYYAGGNNRVGAASQSYAMDRNAAACACPPTIINNTIMNDNIRTVMQPSVMQINRTNFGTPFNQSAFAAGAAIGGLLRRLF